MTRSINFVLLLSGAALAFVSAQVFTGPEGRQVEVFVNVYNHPKTGFSCADKAPGQYYADPATKCAVYYVCIANPTGTLSPQSFACPNGTIFSQATRVCKPHEEVYCPLATRYYDNLQGLIDQKGEIDVPPLPVPVQPIQPVQHQPRRQSAPRTKPQPAPQPQPQPQPLTPVLLQSPPQPQPKPAQPASSLFNSNSRFRNTRTFSAPATTSTTTSAPAPAAAAGPESRGSPADYEYDYNDYGNETGIANAASSLHAQIIENIAEAIAKESKDAEKSETADSAAAAEKAVSRRRKRQSEPWMLSRRKGQLMEALGDLMSHSGDDAQSTAAATTSGTATTTTFTCEDKIAGVAYADIQSGCSKFYVCVTVAKAKLWSYHLNCDQGKRFNQALGMCTDTHLSDKTCARSERYYAYNKWHKASKKHYLDSAKKMSAQQ